MPRYHAPRSRRVEVGWRNPATEEEFRVVLDVTLGTRPRGMDPGEPSEIEVVEVTEDAPGGAERPDLIDLVERDLDRLECSAYDAAREAAEFCARDES